MMVLRTCFQTQLATESSTYETNAMILNIHILLVLHFVHTKPILFQRESCVCLCKVERKLFSNTGSLDDRFPINPSINW